MLSGLALYGTTRDTVPELRAYLERGVKSMSTDAVAACGCSSDTVTVLALSLGPAARADTHCCYLK